MATTIGVIQLLATIDTSQYKAGEKQIEQSNKNIANSANTTEKSSNTAFSGIAKIGLAAVAAAAVAVGVAIVKNIGNAVDRIDTLVAFPRVLQALGATSKEATDSTTKLSESLRGLPTSLQAGASGVQGLVTAGLGVDKATDAFLALNNALLVSGGGTAQAEAAMLQLQQALSRGKIEGQEWNTIAASMPTVLQALAKETGKSKDELREMFAENPQGLIDNIIRLNKDGGGGLASLDKQARDATGGIGTAFDNMNNAITRGIEGIVKSIGGGDLEAGQKKISDSITALGNAFGAALLQVGAFVSFMIEHQEIFAPLILAIGTIVGLLTTWYVATKVLAAGQAVLNAVMAANPIGLIIIGIAALVVAFLWLWNNVEGFRNFFLGAWDVIKGAVMGVFDWVKKNWPLLLAIIAGPIGLAVLAIIKNFDKIKDAAQTVFNWIKNLFSTVANVVAGAFKGVINGVLWTIEKTINGYIALLNGAIGIINKIPGVKIGNIPNISVPRLAEGGIITSPTLALVGEGKESEAVIPLSKLDKMLNNDSGSGKSISVTVNMSGVMARSTADLRDVGKEIIEAVNQGLRAKGQQEIPV